VDGTTTIWLPIVVLVPALIFWGYCLLDFSRTDELEMRAFSKHVWLVILIFGSVIGGILWCSVGRPQGPASR
jgi:hypothetical protein